MPYKDPIKAKECAAKGYLKNKEKYKARASKRYREKIQFGGRCIDCEKAIKITSIRCNKCRIKNNHPRPMLGRSHSKHTRKLMSLKATGPNNHNYGISISEEHKKILRQYRGEKHWNWKGNVSKKNQSWRTLIEYGE